MGQQGVARTKSLITFAGLLFAMGVPILFTLLVLPAFSGMATSVTLETIIGLAGMWLTTIGVMGLMKYGEHRSWTSVGLSWPSWKMMLQGLVIGVVLSLAVPLLSVLASTVIPAGEGGTIASVTQISWWLMLMSVVTAGVTEEILFRGYALERLLAWSGSKWFSSLISLAAFTAVHVAGWNPAHLFGVVIPLGAALTVLYWWRRNVVVVIIAHVTINLPLVFMAAAMP